MPTGMLGRNCVADGLKLKIVNQLASRTGSGVSYASHIKPLTYIPARHGGRLLSANMALVETAKLTSLGVLLDRLAARDLVAGASVTVR